MHQKQSVREGHVKCHCPETCEKCYAGCKKLRSKFKAEELEPPNLFRTFK